ncbi:MAG: IS1595 family transposase [Paludibacteraceae bacterium]|nr:IS1595 family transposase [Paludibacteraceae bacterium]
MKLIEFINTFNTEEDCNKYFKGIRDEQGVTCKKCGCREHYWKSDKECYQCKKCGFRMSLKSGTIFESSKLSLRTWFIAIHLITSTKHTVSASELQRQLGMKRYQPVWEMLHKIRTMMGMRDDEYTLSGDVEVDEAFFSTECHAERKSEAKKRGSGSQYKTKVMVMVESEESQPTENGGKKKRTDGITKKVGRLKMKVMGDLKPETADKIIKGRVSQNSIVYSDATKTHKNFGEIFKKFVSYVIEPKAINKVLPWVHIAISNAKSLFTDTYHGMKGEFLQSYLDEFCYKFNRRYVEDIFVNVVRSCALYENGFSHRLYGTKPYEKKAVAA